MRHLLHKTRQAWQLSRFTTSGHYWEERYRLGGDSGAGSYGELAKYKASFINAFVAEHKIQTVLEIGCGDGSQVKLARYPHYLGFDVSKTAIQHCSERFAGDPSKAFFHCAAEKTDNVSQFCSADLVLSLDVIYHLVEEEAFHNYIMALFRVARKWVIIYSSNYNEPAVHPHVRHRRFTDFVQENWPEFLLLGTFENPLSEKTFAEFFVFQKVADRAE